MRGIRVDYLSPTLYFLDILIILFLLSFVPQLTSTTAKKFINSHRLPLACLVSICVLSLVIASNKLVAFYAIVRYAELILLGVGAKTVIQREGESSLPKLALVFGIGMVLSTCIAFSQFLKQGSIGGILYFIGERSFSSETPGIANASINGMLLLRPYGTFPHPNVLAWYLFVGLVLCIVVLLLRKRYDLPSPFVAILILATIFGSATIVLTLSRSVLLAFVLYILFVPFIFFRTMQLKMLIGLYIGFVLLLLGLYSLTPLGGRISPLLQSDKAIVERNELLYASTEMLRENPYVGVGAYNFIVRLPEYYTGRHILLQPVHNIYMLVVAEMGVLGLALFLYVLWHAGKSALTIKDYKIRSSILFLFMATLVLGVADHYMATLEQSQILFVLLIVLCFALPQKKLQKGKA